MSAVACDRHVAALIGHCSGSGKDAACDQIPPRVRCADPHDVTELMNGHAEEVKLSAGRRLFSEMPVGPRTVEGDRTAPRPKVRAIGDGRIAGCGLVAEQISDEFA